MVKSQAILFLASALCIVSLVSAVGPGPTGNNNTYTVEGQVYCDTCRTQFITKVSEFLEGVKVKLECRNLTGSEKISYSAEAVTDKDGRYTMAVDGDYEDNDCEVVLLQSPRPDCSEIPRDTYTRQAAKVSLTSNNGVVDTVRHANPLGFLRKDPLPECPEVLKELGVFY